MAIYRKLALLLWKNWLLQRRHKLQTIAEILAPLSFCSMVIILRCLINVKYQKEPSKYEPVPPLFLPPHSNATPFTWSIAWSPNNSVLNSMMDLALTVPKVDLKDVFGSMEDFPPINLSHIPFESSKKLTEYLTNPIENNMNYTLAGVEFPDDWNNILELPKNVEFKLRFPAEKRFFNMGSVVQVDNWKTNHLFDVIDAGPNLRYIDTPRGSTPYFYEGFVTLQNQISMAVILLHLKSNILTRLDNILNDTIDAKPDLLKLLTLNRFPYPPFIYDELLIVMQIFFPTLMMLSFVYTSMNIVKVLTYEKEKQLKEAMKIMGLPNWLHWTAWFIKTVSFLLIFVGLMVFMLKIPWYNNQAVLTKSNAGVLFLFITMYLIASIFFCFMISAFFSRANLGSAVTGLLWFISFAPYMVVPKNYPSMTFNGKLFPCLLSNTAMGYGFLLTLMSEGADVGLQWNNIMKPVSKNDDFYMGVVLIMFSIDSLIYLIITLYVEQIFPGEFGVAKPWYFPFTLSFWRCKSYTDSGNVITLANSTHEELNWEPTPKDLEAGVSIKELRKVYRSTGKVAVACLNLDMFKNQITSLLGHNGAGKTTTMNILTGMIQPTSGTAIINGFDIRKNIAGVRNSLGYCPQHNILFDELTVKEHLYFFSKLKGLHGKQLKAEVSRYIKELDLEKQSNVQARHLSGGMQRKLSVAIAFCGGSVVVFCDEPTAGMDPSARKSLWDLLQREKQGRTILLTTHFMDEADLLGDRIAIMAGGKLICVGSSAFLKKIFTDGFQLVISKETSCDTSKVTNLLRKHIPSLEIKSDIGSELRYVLSEEYSNKFEAMLHDLESSANDLKLLTFQISSPTLDDVFMKTGSDNTDNEDIIDTADQSQQANHVILKGVPLVLNQFYSMSMKKILIVVRTWPLLLVQILIPLIFLTICITVIRQMERKGNDPPLKVKLNSYDKTVTTINIDENTGKLVGQIKMEYENSIRNHSKSHELRDIESRDMNEDILEKSLKSLHAVRSKYILGATFSRLKLKAWFNDQVLHSIPLSLNLMHNAVLKAFAGREYGIEVINYPLPFNPASRTKMMHKIINMGFNLGFLTGFSMSFVSSFYIIFIIKERFSKIKHLQFVSGVGVLPFWIPAIICDYLTFCLTALIFVLYFACYQEQGFSTPEQLHYLMVTLLSFGFAMLPMTYIAAYFFSLPATGFVRMVTVYVFVGPSLYLIIHVLFIMEAREIADLLEEIVLLAPHYAVCAAVRNMNEIALRQEICSLMCQYANVCDVEVQCSAQPLCCILLEQNYYLMWNKPGLGKMLTYFIVEGILSAILLLIIEFSLIDCALYGIQTFFRCLRRQLPPLFTRDKIISVSDNVFEEGIDEDVLTEKQKVNSLYHTEIKNYELVMKNLTKRYKRLLVVNKICVAVKAECFGLLGSNGAGKTTVFKMLTGDELISDGIAWVEGLSVKTHIVEVNKLIGYCPQFHGLNDNLTGRENLKIFCLLRGIRKRETSTVCVKLAKDLNFIDHIDKKVSEYSGGNKRKLSTAVALIGNPRVIYLDEPTAGMDISSKRNFWNAVCKVRELGRCIILTSNSMEECEILCNRLAIMVNGEFMCLGSTQQLKNKFSTGFTLTIKTLKNKISADQDFTEGSLYTAKLDNVKEFIYKHFPEAKLQDEYQCVVVYDIPISAASGSKIFGVVNKARDQLQIEDYKVGHTSLQQVFISFIKKQRY